MWVLNGPFDGEVAVGTDFTKAKLLKPGKTYGIGRKACPLIVNNKKISSSLGEFIVGDFGEDDVMDPESRPRLEFVNKKDKALKLQRKEKPQEIRSNSPHELLDGDVIALINGLYVSVEWKEVCCYVAPIRGKPPIPLAACAALGIHVVYDTNLKVTHHVCSALSANPIFAASLLSLCEFVKVDWLNEVIKLGQTALEENFSLPLTSKYLPDFSDSLQDNQRLERTWQPNEERHSMLAPYRFICVDEKGRELNGDFRDMIERGAGSFEAFDPHSGRAKFHKALARGQAKEGKTQVIIGKQLSIQAAVGKDGWQDLLQEVEAYQLGFIPPEQVVQAIIETNPSLLTGGTVIRESETFSGPVDGSSSTPETSLALEDVQEESQPRRKLVRRATSRQPSQEPSAVSEPTTLDIPLPSTGLEEFEAPPRSRRALTRRVNAGLPVLTGLDDPSSIIDAVPDLDPPRQNTPPPPPIITDLTAPTPNRPRKLKRRAVGGVPDVAASQALWGIEETPIESEPPLKKFKALFDASGQETFDESAFNEVQSGSYTGISQTQSQTQGGSGQNGQLRRGQNLSILREEEEEESQMSSVNLVGNKRPLQDLDENMEHADDAPTSAQPSKRRAIENVNAVDRADRGATGGQGKPPSTATDAGTTSKPPSTVTKKGAKTGAEPGKPDQDHAFLKALASTKKGKRKEDEFDRDFNNLKISKPNIDRPNPADEWKLLAEFGDDSNLRGNFMTIVELPAYNRSALDNRRQAPDPAWNGLPNFKKFRRKNVTQSVPVQVFAPETNDYGIGAAYWKSGTSQQGRSQQSPTEDAPRSTNKQQRPAPTKTQDPVEFSDSEGDSAPVKGRKTGRGSSRAASAVPPKRPVGRRVKSEAPEPLFLEDSDEDDNMEGDDDVMDVDDDTSTLATNTVTKTRSQQSNARVTARGKKPIITVDDDSDDGVFKGFGAKSKRR